MSGSKVRFCRVPLVTVSIGGVMPDTCDSHWVMPVASVTEQSQMNESSKVRVSVGGIVSVSVKAVPAGTFSNCTMPA